MDIIGIGNPILDKTIHVSESFLEQHGLEKGTMKLADDMEIRKMLEAIVEYDAVKGAGGSVGNCLAAASVLGASTLFIGCIGSGRSGDEYQRLTKEADIVPSFSRSEYMQGTCVVLITPDGQRTFVTYLGACLDLKKEDLPHNQLTDCKIVHIEGYQLDGENNVDTIFEAIPLAKKNGALISVDLADSALIKRHDVKVKELVIDHADIVFANEDEALAFTGKEEEEAAKDLAQYCKLAIVKLGEHGSIIATAEGEILKIPGEQVTVANTNGAGDAYAGAFLASYTQGKSLEECGKCASHIGALVVKSEASRLNKDMME